MSETTLSSSKDVVPPVEETIKNMFCGRRYILSCYRSLEHKLELLDAALGTFDGNIILTVSLASAHFRWAYFSNISGCAVIT